MKLSVIFADNRIVKDGLGYVVTLPDEPEIWAIQWGGAVGHIEYRDATTLNEVFTDADVIAPYVALWQAAHDAATFVPEPTLDDVLATIAAYRWNRTQRMDYDGETDVPADPALSVITSIAVAEQLAPSGGATRTFKLKPGAFRQWTVAQIVGYGMAIGAHVQACFDREKELADLATGGDIAGALAALETGWPA